MNPAEVNRRLAGTSNGVKPVKTHPGCPGTFGITMTITME